MLLYSYFVFHILLLHLLAIYHLFELPLKYAVLLPRFIFSIFYWHRNAFIYFLH